MSFAFPFGRLLRVRYFCYYPYDIEIMALINEQTKFIVVEMHWETCSLCVQFPSYKPYGFIQ